MNNLLDRLTVLCRDRVVDEKILIVPSLAIGHQIGDRIAQSGTAWINLRVETIRTLADAVASVEIAREKVKVLSRAQALSFVEKACDDALAGSSYFAAIVDRPGFHRAMQRSLDDLRLAGVHGTEMRQSRFEDQRKAADLQRVLETYEKELARGPFVDRCAVLQRATSLLESGAKPPFEPEAIWIAVEEMELASAEEKFLTLISRGRLIQLSSSPEPITPAPATRTSADGKSSRVELRQTSAQLPLFPVQDRRIEIDFIRSLGEENEIRGAFRAVLGSEMSFDKAELVYTERATYLPLVYELAAEYNVPATYAEGVSASFTRPGAAALGFLAWVGGGYESAVMEKLFRAGAVDLYGSRGNGPSARAVARVLRDAAIGWGRDRYLTRIRAWKEARQLRLTDVELSEPRRLALIRDVEAASVAEDFFRNVLSNTEAIDLQKNLQIPALAESVALFVSEFSAIRNEIDGMARSALERMMNELAALPVVEVPRQEAADRLWRAVIELHVGASNPRPGHLHVTPIRLSGWSGRNRLFVVGLDDTRHPGGAVQDPVLLDAERGDLNQRIAPRKLSLLSERPLRNSADFLRFLDRSGSIPRSDQTRPRVTLSYSSLDLQEQRGRYPSSTLLQLYRQKFGDEDLTYEALLKRLASHKSSFVPDDTPLNGAEWWLRALFTRKRPNSREQIESAYRWLGRGREAVEARNSDAFTRWDGAIDAPAADLDPRLSGVVLSASRLEKLANCPFRYFLEHVLRVEPLESLERDPERWLTPADFGSMLHEVLQTFMEEVCERVEKPTPARHAVRLREIAESAAKIWTERIPPPSTSAFERQRDDLQEACEVFLRTEERECGSVTATYFEAGFGDGEGPLPLFSIDLGGGKAVRVRGRIDRVDRADDEPFWDVWDYKSGSTFRFEGGGRFGKGTRIQHAIYARAVEAILQASNEKGSVRRSGYYFPSRKGDGLRHAIDVAPGELENVLNLLSDIAASGTFLHAGAENCRFCDYTNVCGNVGEVAQDSERKIAANPGRAGVDAWLKLQEVE